MSTIKSNYSIYVPAVFPPNGRLPSSHSEVSKNYRRQELEFNRHRQKLNEKLGLHGAATCAHSLHISLFFDGTNNNKIFDTKSNPPQPSNIARLYHASIDEPAEAYFSYYMPGVGTPFPEIGELDYSTLGLTAANGGENRINWGLVQIADALTFALTKAELSQTVMKDKVKAMSTTWPLTTLGKNSRRQAMASLLEPLRPKVAKVLPTVLGLKLFVYGFSRGAAEARTFLTWLSELFDPLLGAELPAQKLLGIPVSIEFVGLLDTVASVGSARAAPFAEGHMDWADDTLALPHEARFPEWVKDCRHFVAAHEQRLCFPLDSIRRKDGTYPPYAKEVIYPGVHSDVGGGYPQGDQGKARGSGGEVLSQIVLHDLYAAAFAAGAPLMVPEAMVPEDLKQVAPARAMDPGTLGEFVVSPELITRFNAWRTTLNIADDATPDGDPPLLGHDLETTMAEQLAWLTGWRIERFARGSYASQPFYGAARQTPPDEQKTLKTEREAQIAAIQKRRNQARGLPNEQQILLGSPAPPVYEPVVDRQQLREAAEEFKHDYNEATRPHTSLAGVVFDGVLKQTIYLLNDDDEQQEYQQIKAAGERCAQQLFSEHWRGMFKPSEVPEMAALVALFDDQVHDSRAWFMHNALESREMWGDYFRYRMVYFDGKCNKRMTPAVVAGRVVGIGLVLGGAYSLQRHGWKGAAGMLGAGAVSYEVINALTGEVVPFLPGAEQLLQPTFALGEVVAKQRWLLIREEEDLRKQNMLAYLKNAGALINELKPVAS